MEFTFEMMLTLGLICFAIIGYASGRFPIDAVSISTLGLLTSGIVLTKIFILM